MLTQGMFDDEAQQSLDETGVRRIVVLLSCSCKSFARTGLDTLSRLGYINLKNTNV